MVFNVIYGNTDDHLKNHSFIYDRKNDRWALSPVYDVTYPSNPLIDFKSTKRALSINGKREHIDFQNIYKIADDFTIKNPEGIVRNIQGQKTALLDLFGEYDIPKAVSERIGDEILRMGYCLLSLRF